MPDKTQTLAGTFSCYAPPGYRNHERRILYVGKATAGPFQDENAPERWFDGNGAFWSFARSVSRLADHNCTDLSNLAWSNIFKQGVARGNPAGNVAEGQRDAAAEELRTEVKKLDPSLIVLVNAGYYEEIVKAAYLIDDGEIGERALTRVAVAGEDRYDLWWRAAHPPYPRIVWMYHPQGKRTEYTDAALDLVGAVTGWAH